MATPTIETPKQSENLNREEASKNEKCTRNGNKWRRREKNTSLEEGDKHKRIITRMREIAKKKTPLIEGLQNSIPKFGKAQKLRRKERTESRALPLSHSG